MMRRVLLTMVLLLLAPVSARAGFTTPINPGHGSEPNLLTAGGVLDTLYGLGNLLRIHDNITTNTVTDQLWVNTDGGATIEAKFAGFVEVFGFYVGSDSSAPNITVGSNTYSSLNQNNLFRVENPNGYSPTVTNLAPGPFPAMANMPEFRWGLDPNAAPPWTSTDSQNVDTLDHMLTFWVIGTGLDDIRNIQFVLAWDDRENGDRDFNDLVVEVKNAAPKGFDPNGPEGDPVVPEPSTLALAAIGLATLGGRHWRRRQK